MRLACCIWLVAASALALGRTDAYLAANLLPDGAFESGTNGVPAGWNVTLRPRAEAPGRMSMVTTAAIQGRTCVRLDLERAGYLSLVSTNVPVAPEQYYFVRFAFRVEGLCDAGAYCGGAANLVVEWLDAQRRTVGRDHIGSSYVPLLWSYRDQVCRAPAGAAACRVTVAIVGRAETKLPAVAWFDDVAVMPYRPPPFTQATTSEWSVTAGRHIFKAGTGPSWVYLAGRDGRENTQAQRIREEGTLTGFALRAPTGVAAGYTWHSPYTLEQPCGLHRLIVRARLPAEHGLAPDAIVMNVDVNSSDSGHRMRRTLSAGDFGGVAYRSFTFDFVKRTSGWLSFRVHTPGAAATFLLDHVAVAQLYRFNDPDLAEWFPGIAPALGAEARIAQNVAPRLLVVNGLLADRFRLAEAVRNLGRVEATRLTYRCVQAGGRIDDFPTQWEQLREHHVVVLANAAAHGLRAPQRYLLREFVRAGGGLVILGGKAAFGAGGLRGSFLDELLPVDPSPSAFDIARVDAPLVPCDGAGPITAGLARDEGPLCRYLHEVTLRDGARLFLTAAGKPFLAGASFGSGRCVCILGAPYGTSGKDGPFFGEWADWPILLRNAMLWAASRDGILTP